MTIYDSCCCTYNTHTIYTLTGAHHSTFRTFAMLTSALGIRADSDMSNMLTLALGAVQVASLARDGVIGPGLSLAELILAE